MRYFGTDGIRGVYGVGITEDLAYRAGRSLGYLLGGRCIVGRDTRLSGPELESALVRGLTESGTDAECVGVLPTPAVSEATSASEGAFGVMISASHNPPEYNGIKVFLPSGVKPGEAIESAVEYYMDDLPPRASLPGRVSYRSGTAEYLARLMRRAKETGERLGRSGRLDGMRVLLDCAGGAAGKVARELFSALGAEAGELCSDCRGECINVRCGALHPESMAARAESGGYDVGLSFDGDADRLVVWRRRLMTGDEMMYNISGIYPAGSLVVGTAMYNRALERALAARGKRFVRTAVGDRNVGEVMAVTRAVLGGEPSGHFILEGSRTGDGLLSGVAACLILSARGLDSLDADPQKLVSVPCCAGATETQRFRDACADARRLARRIVVRPSGTEPLLRIMAEGGDVDGAVALIAGALS